ncbi:MAG: chorismate synthase [bacterium]
MLRYFTSGESHGKGLVAIIEGLPAGLFIDQKIIGSYLSRRQMGYGRGKRMSIEKDHVDFLSGVRAGYTIGSPVAIYIENKDWQNWQNIMDPFLEKPERIVTMPRPGHADLAGGIKYNHHDLRNVLERASARETAIRTAVGAIASLLLNTFDIRLYSYVIAIGNVKIDTNKLPLKTLGDAYLKRLNMITESDINMMNMPDLSASKKAVELIEKTKKRGDTLGGVFEVRATNIPVGLGSYSQWDRRLDARLACALMSIQAIKAVELGNGMENAGKYGSMVHDEIFYRREKGFYRKTNHAGGIEGGVTNGEELILRAYMKPISTLYKPLRSVNVITKKPVRATVERSDICAVPAASIVGEAVVAIELAKSMIEKFGGDTVEDMKANYKSYITRIKQY